MNRIEYRILKTAITRIQNEIVRNKLRLGQLAQYKVTVMKKVTLNGLPYYQYKTPDGKFKYLGTESNDKVQATKEARYLEELNRRHANNLSLFETVAAKYLPTDNASITETLPLTYRGCKRFPDPDQDRERRVAEWKAEKAKTKASYPVKNPEQLTIPYRDGTMMRSKSEVIDGLMIEDSGLAFVYEVPVVIDNRVLYPDFVILDPFDLETEYLLEHFGRMDLTNYQGEVGFKIAQYMKIGYMPWNNFFMTFDRIDGSGIDLIPLYDMIDKIYARGDAVSSTAKAPNYGILMPIAAGRTNRRRLAV